MRMRRVIRQLSLVTVLGLALVASRPEPAAAWHNACKWACIGAGGVCAGASGGNPNCVAFVEGCFRGCEL